MYFRKIATKWYTFYKYLYTESGEIFVWIEIERKILKLNIYYLKHLLERKKRRCGMAKHFYNRTEVYFRLQIQS